MKRFYVNGWTDAEEKKLVEIMMDGQRNGKGVHELFDDAEREIGRSGKSCMNRWYSIRHKHLKEIV